MKNPDNVVEFDNVHTYFFTDIGIVKAVDGVSFEVPQGKTVGIVGESGCGKSTFVRMVISLDKPTSGEILYHGKNLADLSKKETWLNRQNMQMVFQDPLASFDPKMKIVDILTEPLIKLRKIKEKRERKQSKRTAGNGRAAGRFRRSLSS